MPSSKEREERMRQAGIRERMKLYQENTKKKNYLSSSQRDVNVGKLDTNKHETLLSSPKKVNLNSSVGKLDASFSNIFGGSTSDLNASNGIQQRGNDSGDLEMSPEPAKKQTIKGNDMPNLRRADSMDAEMELDFNRRDGKRRTSEEDEALAKATIAYQLDEEDRRLGKEVNEESVLASFAEVRKRYVEAVTPLLKPGKFKLDKNAPKDKQRKKFREHRRKEGEKKEKLDTLSKTFHTYEKIATDKPDELDPEEEFEREKMEQIEDDLNDEWTKYAENVVKAAEEQPHLVDEKNENDILKWIDEAKRLKAEKEARKKKREEDMWAREGRRLKEKGHILGDDDDSSSSSSEEEEEAKSTEEAPENPKKEETDKKQSKKDKKDAKKAKKKKSKVSYDSDSDSSESFKGKKRKKKDRHRSSDKELKEDAALAVKEHKNLDGTIWKNTLKYWMNAPKKVHQAGAGISCKIPAKTDCWRKTRHNFIMDNAPFYSQKVMGDFEVMVKVSGDLSKMYDKAGIMIRRDEENWIYSGMEHFNDRMNHATAVTKDWTDWSLAPLPENAESAGIWFCVKRMGNAYESFYSLDSRTWVQTRQGVFTDGLVKVGVFGASPMGFAFKVYFDYYQCRSY